MSLPKRPLDGLINLNKPAGISSHRAVALVRRLAPGVKVGHGGTLDPAASGVLPLCLGRATRIAEYLFDLRKGYRAALTLGVTTESGDAAGAVISRSEPPPLERAGIETLFRSLTGAQEQQVPAYAAVKYRGRPLYEYARRGVKIPPKKRTVQIYRLELLSFDPAAGAQITCEVECSRGTYIRSLAVEIGERLGCGAHLQALERLFVGPLTVGEAHSPEQLSAAAAAGELHRKLLPLDRVLAHLEALHLPGSTVEELRLGRAVPYERSAEAEALFKAGLPVRIYDPENRFRALARFERSASGLLLKTDKFLSP
ncbi:MAG: tRNA pseudouridine(55) synthase TruB [Firmicutes bacterium]|nr:tRNA pseudouridine(55) synthase TruB [Bacillota bacterium]